MAIVDGRKGARAEFKSRIAATVFYVIHFDVLLQYRPY
jgi:hypothetical protein